MSARRSVRGREAVVAATPAGAGEEERAPADAVGEEHAHQDEARLDRPDGHGGGAVRLHTDRLEHQRAVEEDGVDAGRCTKNCSPTAHVGSHLVGMREEPPWWCRSIRGYRVLGHLPAPPRSGSGRS